MSRNLSIRVRVFAIAFLTAASSMPADALDPGREVEYRQNLKGLQQGIKQLSRRLAIAFQPGSKGGLEEIAWRMRDLHAKAEQIELLSENYWNNETAVRDTLKAWFAEAKVVDETMLYAELPEGIAALWNRNKGLAEGIQAMIEELPSQAQWDRILEDYRLQIVKVGHYKKSGVLREMMKEVVGGSELDKWPFPDEQKALPVDMAGEHYVVYFKVQGGALPLPVKVRFEYRRAKAQGIETREEIFGNLSGGKYSMVCRNVGEEFLSGGTVLHWKASLILNDEVIATKESAMWNVAGRGS